MLKHIRTIVDVSAFGKQIIYEGVSFHPDEDFNNYVSSDNNKPRYSIEEADLRNDLMSKCFVVCKMECMDIYNLMLECILIETHMDKFIPLPSVKYSKD